ncbi:Cof-type HAD-IIB family hydrolase [Vagococcus entomophilus]|uniref:HAD family hydrolase n=1 Tax=Vagococcus entomophilus TaxID=1160095 RepID=A0A430AGV0_9ENTE|nr:Cof-type HAD-IIB family hydrolase [Vagococcus entomophilus]RSU07159.1 HAD family hydrolase [Vagococcus entomophilus]
MIGLIASDMDGTLLDEHMSISKENAAAVKRALSMGIHFMVATGRGATEALPALEEVGIKCPMITGNGAQAYDAEGQTLFTFSIEKENVQQIIQILKENQLYFEIATNKGVYSDNQPQRVENAATMIASRTPGLSYKMAVALSAAHLDLLHIIYIKDYLDLLEDPTIEVLKFIVFNEEGQKVLQPIASQISKLDNIFVTSSYPTNIEINHAMAQKGIAVKKMAEKYDIPLDQVMTIGDNFNDISMLQIAGVSFAMANAEPEVKEQAKYLTQTNIENGVGKAIIRAIEESL